MFSYLFSIIVFILVLGFLIFIHEFAHFLSAKLSKVRVDEFGFGLPPKIWGKKKGETEYTINALPIGGFVRLAGEDSEEVSSDPRDFSAQAPWKRALMVAAGVAANFLLAVFVFTTIYTIGGPIESNKVVIGNVEKNSPAALAGLKEEDLITAIDGRQLEGRDDFQRKVKDQLGKDLTLTIEREKVVKEVKLKPRKDPPAGQGPIGIGLLPYVETKAYPIWESPIVGTEQTFKMAGTMIDGLRGMLRDLVVKKEVPEGVGGVVRIGYLTHIATQAGPISVLMLLGLLSLNLAIINILPLPALDGGRLVFILIEFVTKKRVPLRFEKWIHAAGMVLIILLVVLITYQDLIWLWFNTSLGEKLHHLIPFS
ncbi:MAG: M50 family metallopeptidase [Patescibacteria group bacterium]|nr:M50 family metallopeptidase [Patescibacteria group bacterium]